MNKKKLALVIVIGTTLVFPCYLGIEIIRGNILVISEDSLPEINDFEVSKALTSFEMTGEEKMKKDYSLLQYLNMMESQKNDYWNEIEKLQKEIDELERELRYRHDVSVQLDILYTLQKYGKHFLGYLLWPIGRPQGVAIVTSRDYESEIVNLKNEVELLKEGYIKKKIELKTLYNEKDITLISQIKELRREIDTSRYGYKRYVLLSTVVPYKLKKGESLEITPSWEEGEHYLSLEKDHVWIGMYSTETPGTTNFLGCYTTDVFTHDMNFYWEEALKKNPETGSIRIKWIYISEGHRIVWEGNKNESEEWYTFAEYEGDPEDGVYTVVNMNLLNYPEYQQYYVVM